MPRGTFLQSEAPEDRPEEAALAAMEKQPEALAVPGALSAQIPPGLEVMRMPGDCWDTTPLTESFRMLLTRQVMRLLPLLAVQVRTEEMVGALATPPVRVLELPVLPGKLALLEALLIPAVLSVTTLPL